MRTPASIFKHPIHPMLIVFPIGLWIFSLACDLIRLAGASGDAWSTVAFFTMIGGLIGALCAAVSGFIDLLFYKGGAPPLEKVALTHMAINLTAVVLYAINVWLRASGLGNAPERSRRAVSYRRSSPLRIRLALAVKWCMSTVSASRGVTNAVTTYSRWAASPTRAKVRHESSLEQVAAGTNIKTENSHERSPSYDASRSWIG